MGEFVVVPISLLVDLADSLEAELQARYPERGNYDVEHRRFNRDMEPVAKARELLEAQQPEAEPVDGGKVWSIVRSAMGAVQYFDEREISSEERHALIDSYASEYADKIAALYSAPPDDVLRDAVYHLENKTFGAADGSSRYFDGIRDAIKALKQFAAMGK